VPSRPSDRHRRVSLRADPPEVLSERSKTPSITHQLVKASFKDIFHSFVLMGWTAFGGPAAHIGIFQKAFVEGKRWMSVTVFNELLSLGQCMPGPTSTQVSFAIGVTQKGIPGGLLSGMLFQYPGLMMMSLSAGLSAAGVALVVSAAVGLAKGQCKDQTTSALCLMSAVVAYYYVSNWIFPLLIVVGGLTTIYANRGAPVKMPDANETIAHLGLSKVGGGLLILAWIVIWVVVVSFTSTMEYADNKELHWFEAFYRTGSIIFGGGQVVLPLLLKDVTDVAVACVDAAGAAVAAGTAGATCVAVETAKSWITEEQFFAGLAIVQAMPGPLFNLSAYIGALAARRAGSNVAAGIAAAWLGLFGPGVMLIYGILPFWGAFRMHPTYRRALPGLNSSAVGLVVAAVFQMSFKVRSLSPHPDASVVIGILAFYATHFGVPRFWTSPVADDNGQAVVSPPWKMPAPLAILAGGVLGLIAWGAGCT
jgi:chromate transporter